MSEHERPVEPFSDLHVEDGQVRATLLHDPTVEGLDMAIYMDASGSMEDEYQTTQKRSGGGIWGWLTGKPAVVETVPNQVEPQVHWMLEYLATKDRNGILRVAYWACGPNGADVEVIGELMGKDARTRTFPGPGQLGGQTRLAPAVRDYVKYIKAQAKKGAKQGCAVFVTDGHLHDADEVKTLTDDIADQIAKGHLPRVNFVLVGVGDQIDEEQLEGICHAEYDDLGHPWCHRIAKEITQVAELVAVLVDETMTVAGGGTIYDDKGNVLRAYEGRLPAVLEFKVPEGAKSFTLEVNGQRFTQPLPDGDEDEDHH